MKRSTDRILTTHAGSLPRPDDLARLMWDEIDKKPVDTAKVRARVKDAVAEIVKKQDECGVDVVSDGEMSKVGFSNYVTQRFSGFGERAGFMSTDLADVPDVAGRAFGSEGGQHIVMPCLEGPMT